MTYPYTRLTRPYRVAIMLALIASFFVIAPLILLYTMGYRYDVSTRAILQTGVISIDVEPSDAVVSINGQQIQNSLPLRLTNRAPGTYHIKIEAPGFQSWERDITVTSRQTTYIRNITLFAEHLPELILNDPREEIIQTTFSQDGKHALLIKKNALAYSVDQFDTENQTVTTLIPAVSEEPIISWSPFGSFFALMTPSGDQLFLTLADLSQGLISEPYTIGASPDKISWQWNERNQFASLYLSTAESISEFTITRERLISERDELFPWYIDYDRTLWTFDPKKKTLSSTNESIPMPTQISEILHLNGERIIAREGNGIVLIDRKEPTSMHTIETQEVIFNRETEEWLTWSPWELWTIYPNGDRELLTRTSIAIKNTLPLDAYGLLLFQTEADLRGFNPGYYITHQLFDNGEVISTGVNQEERIIFFYGSVGSRYGVYALRY